MTSTSSSSGSSGATRSTARRWSSSSTRRRRTGSRGGTARPSTSTCTTSARTSSGGCPPGRTRAGRSGQVTERRLPPRRYRLAVPGHGLDPAPRGRAPPAVGAPGLLHPQPDAQARGARRPAGGDRPAGLHRRRPAAVAGPLAGRRLVGAGRRAQAVARRRRHRADGRRPDCSVRAAGPARADDRPAPRTVGRRRRSARARRGRNAGSADPLPEETAARGDGAARRPTTRAAGVKLRVRGLPDGDERRRRRQETEAPAASRRRFPPSAVPRPTVSARRRRSSLAHVRPPAARGARPRRRATRAGPDPDDRFRGPLHLRRAGRRSARRPDRPVGRRSRSEPTTTDALAADRGRSADAAEAGGRRPPAAPASRTRSGSTPTTSSCCSSRSRRTSIRGSSASTATSTTTSRGAGPAPAWRWSCAVRARAPVPSRGRVRLGPLGPLVAGGLLVVEDADRPFLTRSLRVPDRVAAHLLGDDTADPAVRAAARRFRGDRHRRRRTSLPGRSTPPCRSSTSASAQARPAARWPAPRSPDSGGPPWSSTWAGSARPTSRGRSRAAAASREAGLLGGGRGRRPDRGPRRAGRGALFGRSPSRGPARSSSAAGPGTRRGRCEPPLLLDAPVRDGRPAPRAVASSRSTSAPRGGLRPGDRDARVPARARADHAGRPGRARASDARRAGR